MMIDTAEAKKILVNASIRSGAIEAGFRDPEDVLTIIDRSEIKIDDEGNVTGIESTLKQLATDKPYLLAGGKKIVFPKQWATLPGDQIKPVESVEQKRDRIYGGGGSRVFTPTGAIDKGGGVDFDPDPDES